MSTDKGYKFTEVGMIPEDWEVKTLISISEKIMVGIASAATHAYTDKGIVLFRNQNIQANYLDDSDILYVNEEYELQFKGKRLEEGDLLTARTGYPGTTCVVPSKYVNAQSFTTLITRPKKFKVNPHFLSYFINSDIGVNFFERNKIGGGQKNINAATLKLMPILLPPLPEQTAIASALSDMDALIAQTEKLIEKKKAIKQGVMQELLKPKEGWVTRRLGDFGKTFGGITGKTKSDFGKGSAYYIPFMNIMKNPIIDISFLEQVDILEHEAQNKVHKGDLFFNGSSETPEEVGLCSLLDVEIDRVYLNSFCFGYRLFNQTELNGHFLAYYFRSPLGRNLIFSLAQGATRYNLSKISLLKLELPLPKKEEQDLIALTLSDMDNDIAMHETKLQKLKLQKQGMMQVLLTGKIRLT
jgi:type I restriction enzyme S subunit